MMDITMNDINSNLMGLCKKDVTPLLMLWSYVFLALTHHTVIGKHTCIRKSSDHWMQQEAIS